MFAQSTNDTSQHVGQKRKYIGS